MKSYDSWLEDGAHQQSQADDELAHRVYTLMKPGNDFDPMNLENFQEYLDQATADRKGFEEWQELRQYADRSDWAKFGRAIYFLVHDHIEDKLIAEEE